MSGNDTFYCEMGFWQEFERILQSRDESIDLLSKDRETKYDRAKYLWASIKDAKNIFFYNNEDFKSNLMEEGLLYDFYLRSDSTEGYPEISADENEFRFPNNIEAEKLIDSPIYLLSSKVSDEEKENGNGMLVITSDFCSSNCNYFKDFGKAIAKDQKVKWETILKEAKYNCNSMVIFDRYVFQEEENNLFKILNSLLPEKLDITFHLSIFSLKKYQEYDEKGNFIRKNKEKNQLLLKEQYDKTKKYLEKRRKNLTISLTVYQCETPDFHDRAIITNYLYIGSGGGFDLLQKVDAGDNGAFYLKSGKTTSIPIYFPYLQHGIDYAVQNYTNFRNDAIRTLKKNRHHIGSGDNRLLQ